MRNLLHLFLLTFILSLSARAQITFTKTYPYWAQSNITSVYPVSDGYILCGAGSEFLPETGAHHFHFIIRTDEYGDTLFVKKYTMGSYFYRNGPMLLPASDQEYFLGYSDKIDGEYMSFLQRATINGDALWTRQVSEGDLVDVKYSLDGGLVFTSHSMHGLHLYETDMEGNILWQHLTPCCDSILADNSHSAGFVQMPSGNYKMAVTQRGGFEPAIIGQYLFTFGPTGNFISSDTVYGLYSGVAIQSMMTEGEEILSIGSIDFWGPFIARINELNDPLWMKNYFEPDYGGYFTRLICVTDETYVTAGSLFNGNGSSFMLFAFDSQGDSLWHGNYFQSDNSLAECVAQCPDGGYAAGGYYSPEMHSQACLIKTDAFGHVSGPGIGEKYEKASIKINPNPAKGDVNILLSFPADRLEIIDINGRKVYSRDLSSYNNDDPLRLNISPFASGVYMVKIYGKQRVAVNKLVVGR